MNEEKQKLNIINIVLSICIFVFIVINNRRPEVPIFQEQTCFLVSCPRFTACSKQPANACQKKKKKLDQQRDTVIGLKVVTY